MPRCEAILEETNDICNSNSSLNKVRVEDPNNRFSKTISICQKCSDRIYGPLDALLQHWIKNKNVDWEIKKAEISKIRWKTCRHCHHDIKCRCTDCKNMFDEKWHVIFWSKTGQLRQDFMLHRRCAFIIMKKLGMRKELDFVIHQSNMEKFMDVKLSDPPKTRLVTSSLSSAITTYKKKCKQCDTFLDMAAYERHMRQHYIESSTDKIIEKQYLGKSEMKVEVHICEKHERKAVFDPATSQYKCPVFGCDGQIKLKMISQNDPEDFMICLFHQCKMSYDPNAGKLKCCNPECDYNCIMKKSILLKMVKEGYIEFRGERIPIDIDTRTVFVDGQKILLKI